MYKFFSVMMVIFGAINQTYSSDVDRIKNVFEQAKLITMDQMNSGLSFHGKIEYVNQNFESKGWSAYLNSKSVHPMIRKDVEIYEEFANSNRHSGIVTIFVRNSNSNQLEEINNPDNSFTWIHRSTGCRDFSSIGGCVDYPDDPSINRKWVIESLEEHHPVWQKNEYSLVRKLYAPFYDIIPFNVLTMINDASDQAERLFQQNLSADRKMIIITGKNSLFPEKIKLRVVLSAVHVEKIESMELYYDDGSLKFYTYYKYDPEGNVKSVESFEFNQSGIVYNINEDLKKKATTYQKLSVLQFEKNINFSEDHFNPFMHLKDGDRVEDRINGIYYIQGINESVISLEELREKSINLGVAR